MKVKLAPRFTAIVLCVITVLALFNVASFSAAANTVVTTDAVRLRSTPEISDDNYITTLNVSETLTLLKNSSDGWANVKRSDGSEGYCSVDYLNVPAGSLVTFKGEVTDEVNFRQGPSTDFSSMGYLDKGQDFSVLDNSNEYWVNALVGSKEGYIYREYTKLSLYLGKESSEEPTVPTEPSDSSTEPIATAPKATEPTVEATTAPGADVVPEVKPVSTPNWYSSSLFLSEGISSKISLTEDFCLSAKEASISTGETLRLSALLPRASLDTLVTFESSDEKVAMIMADGSVLGLSEGKAEITASFMGKSASMLLFVSGQPYTPEIPTEPPTTAPVITEPEVTEPATTEPQSFELSASKVTIEKGNCYMLTSPYENTSYKSSNQSVVTVSNGLVKAVSEGKAVITATAEGKTATCEITVSKANGDFSIEYPEVTLTKGKTFYNSADTSQAIIWKTSDKSIATVSNGFITGVKEGVAVITATSAKGSKTCVVNITSAEPVRFAYAYPNTVAKNEDVNLVAITDNQRAAVQFKINVNGTVKTVDAMSKKADGDKIIWTGTTSISEAGTFNVTAYSKLGNKFSACNDGKTTVFVRENKDLLKETKEERRVSDSLITLLASFEGYVGNVYFDNLAGGIPTLGYGKVVYAGESFYNDMTKTEALALLYDTVNNGGYSSNVNTYLQSLDANYNQQQFDALVSFAYNIGYYGLKSDSEIRALILEAKEKKEAENKDKNAAYVNGTEVNFRKGAGTEFESLGLLSYPDTLTLLSDKLVNESWYHVKDAQGREGYIYKDYVTLGVLSSEGEIYLSLIDKPEFTRVLLEYHHAGSNCIYGLLYRRADELDLFYYGDYVRDGDENRFGYSFTCYKDASFKL